RRRHTRFSRDWSSDVCSSDLSGMPIGVVGVAFLLLHLWPAPMAAQTPAVPTHLGHVISGFGGTPEGKGLAVTTAQEVSLLMRHANLAALSGDDLEAMKTHAGHVLHLIDPAEVAEGPGLGFGLKPGMEAIVTHLGLAAADEGA